MPESRDNPKRYDLFAQAAPGLEPIVAAELKSLKKKPHKEIGGAAFRGTLQGIYESNLWLRTASRVLVRLGEFNAASFSELEKKAKRLPWDEYVSRGDAVAVRVTSRKSRLYHSDAVGERVLSAVSSAVPGVIEKAGKDDADVESAEGSSSDAEPERQLFVVRIVNDQCEISADSSGELLHRRGYRKEIGKAPLRETLAAAMLMASRWNSHTPLLDPMCGSGTIPIEAALIARGIAPGLKRRFQFMNWPAFDSSAWAAVLASAASNEKKNSGTIRGSDRDAGVIEAAERNAQRAGVADSIDFAIGAFSSSIFEVDEVPGWVITNPPYGIRVGETEALRNLYASLGASLRTKKNWKVGLLAADDSLVRQTGLALRTRFTTRNGGIAVRYLVSAD